MKKALIIVLAALILICAVSCDDAKKNLGTLKLDLNSIKDYKSFIEKESGEKLIGKISFGNDVDFGDCYEDATIPVTDKDWKRGYVTLRLPAGIYNVALFAFYEDGDCCCPIGFPFVEALEGSHSCCSFATDIVVNAGQTTYCEISLVAMCLDTDD